MLLGFHDNFRLALLINFVLIKKSVLKVARWHGGSGNLKEENSGKQL